MTSERILSLLGLALRGGRLVLGEEPVESVARARDARLILLASDAADNTRRRVRHFADAGQCLWIQVPYTKEQLGQATGRTSVAIAALTDVGLAATIAHRLAETDPARYEESARRLDLKAARAAQRRAEQIAHEKNLRRGRRKSAPAQSSRETPPAVPAQAAPAPKRSTHCQAKSRPSRDHRPRPGASPYAHSRPVKKGKGSFRKRKDA